MNGPWNDIIVYSGDYSTDGLSREQIAYATAADEKVSLDERAAAQLELTKSHMPAASDVSPIPFDEVRRIAEELGSFDNGVGLGFEYGMQRPVVDNDPAFAAFEKSLGRNIPKTSPRPEHLWPSRPRPAGGGPKSVQIDELGIWRSGVGAFRDKPTPFGFYALRRMVAHTAILNAVILTRARQVGRFATTPEPERKQGFVVRPRRTRHNQIPVEHRQPCQWIEDFILNGGDRFNPLERGALRRDAFPDFLQKIVRDTYTMDATPIEVEPTKDGKRPSGFYAMDGATVYLVGDQAGLGRTDEILGVQVIDGTPMQTFNRSQLIYPVRNPRSDIRFNGYGYGETEMFVRLVTGWLHAVTYNVRGFDQNSIPKGFMTLFGDYDRRQLEDFKRHWNMMVKGVANRWQVPVLVSKTKEGGANFATLGSDFNEMHFSRWMVFLTSIVCSCYGMDPSEINFESFSVKTSTLSGSDTAERLANARDKGLEPLLQWVEGWLTDHVVGRFYDSSYVFRFVGVRPEDETWQHEVAKLASTWTEFREAQGMPPLPAQLLPIGTVPMDPTKMQAWISLMQGQGGGQGQGEPGAGEGPTAGVADPSGIGPGGPTPEQAEGSDDIAGRGDGTGPGQRDVDASPGNDRVQAAGKRINGMTAAVKSLGARLWVVD